MFDTYCKPNNNITTKITACSGGIYKTYRESWFESFNLSADRADDLLRKKSGNYKKNEYGYYTLNEELIVIQMIVCGDNKIIAEVMSKYDYEKYYAKNDELEKDLEKYKRVIEILKEKFEIELDYGYPDSDYNDMPISGGMEYTLNGEIQITKEEYELLEEVINNVLQRKFNRVD